MPATQHKARLSTDELLRAAEQLKPRDLERFVARAIALRARSQAPSLSRTESELLLKINRGVPPRVQRRFDELVEKRKAESLSAEERSELLRLISRVEKHDARRIELLGKLARLRKQSPKKLMKELGIGPRNYD